MNQQALTEWLRLHAYLVDREASFHRLAVDVRDGRESFELLQKERVVLDATRELCRAVFDRAFARSGQE